MTEMHGPVLALLLAIMVLAGGEPLARRRLCVTAGLSALIYLDWRVRNFVTADYTGIQAIWLDFFLVVEVLTILDFGIFLLLMSRITDRRHEANRHEARLKALRAAELPDVDVFVTTVDEEWTILEKTIVGVRALTYPNKKIWVLDDGNRDWLADQCRLFGVNYLARSSNEHGKPGNQNFALRQTDAPFIASFDADFIPKPNFLWRCLGFFADPAVGVVQTPQSFYNPDAIHQNLMTQGSVPGELRLFYEQMQCCRDAWDAAFYVGSCAVLRRSALMEIGGFVTGHATEDQITSLRLLAAGHITRYLGENLSTGLASESLFALGEQRKRWARGAIQTLFDRAGPFSPGMQLLHRLLFLQSYWLIGFLAPLVFLCAPMMFWTFGLRPLPEGEPGQLLWVPLLNYLINAFALYRLSNGLYWPVLAQTSQLYLCFTTLPTIATTLLKPFGKPLLSILRTTPKGDAARTGQANGWTGAWLIGITALTIWGMVRAALSDGTIGLVDPIEIVAWLVWTIITLLVATLAALACTNLPWRRLEERFRVAEDAQLTIGPTSIPVRLNDLSIAGANMTLIDAAELDPNEKMTLTLPRLPPLACEIRRFEPGKRLIVTFSELTSNMRISLIGYIFLESGMGAAVLPSPWRSARQLLRRFFRGRVIRE